jgi:hypothetical protein
VIGEDDQRKQEELVRQLSGQLREPDVPESGVLKHRVKATGTFDRQPDGFHDR